MIEQYWFEYTSSEFISIHNSLMNYDLLAWELRNESLVRDYAVSVLYSIEESPVLD